MGLFDLVGELVAAPVRLTATAVKATVKTTGGVVTGDLEAVGAAVEEAQDEVVETFDKVADAAGE